MGEQGPDIGLRVRAARDRLGWSREALAFHSGLSWAGIAQVESGRRRDVRSGTLAALAAALGVSIDYLVLGRPGAPMFEHRLLTYSSEEELVATAAPFLSRASDHAEAALAVTSKRTMALLRRGLGPAAEAVRFIERSSWHSSPMRALNAYEEFCSTCLEQGTVWVRIVADHGSAEVSAPHMRRWIRFESLLNIAFANRPVSMLCAYEAKSLRPTISRQLSLAHPEPMVGHGERAESRPQPDPRTLLLEP